MIGAGQIELVLQEARNEVKLAQKMAEWKPWQLLRQDAPPGQWDWPWSVWRVNSIVYLLFLKFLLINLKAQSYNYTDKAAFLLKLFWSPTSLSKVKKS